VVWSEFAVYQPVFLACGDCAAKVTDMAGDSFACVGEPGVADGRRVEVTQRPVLDDVLGAAGLGCLAASDGAR
jgi:hypothetical protein